MLEALGVFLIQLVYVFLLGFQSRNVRDGQYTAAAMTSFLLGCCGLYLTTMIARAAITEGDRLVQIAYVIAGPVGICLAMHLHDRIFGDQAKRK